MEETKLDWGIVSEFLLNILSAYAYVIWIFDKIKKLMIQKLYCYNMLRFINIEITVAVYSLKC